LKSFPNDSSSLVQQGRTAARVGDIAEARRLLTAATQKAPNNVEAWLELAGVVDSLEEKRNCFAKVLELDPGHASAQAGLVLVEQKLSSQPSSQQPRIIEAKPPQVETGPAFCYRHPDVETGLRCNRCNKPICPTCAQRTPVGFRCPDCIMEIEDRYYSQAKDGDLNPYDRILDTPFFTYVLLGLNALVFLMMELAGGSQNNEILVRFGANYGPLILQGQLWRLFTSMFLHIGLQHLVFNSIGLFIFGVEMERIYGRYRYLVIYLLAGLFGSLASFAVKGPYQFSAGASGAIFGIIGMNLAFFWVYRHKLGEYGRQRRRMVWVLIIINLVLGYTVLPSDNMAHIGGTVAGFILGYALAPRYSIDHSDSSRRFIDRASLLRRWWVLVLGSALFAGGLWLAFTYWSAPERASTFSTVEPNIAAIEYGQTIEGNLNTNDVDLWAFEGKANQIITISKE